MSTTNDMEAWLSRMLPRHLSHDLSPALSNESVAKQITTPGTVLNLVFKLGVKFGCPLSRATIVSPWPEPDLKYVGRIEDHLPSTGPWKVVSVVIDPNIAPYPDDWKVEVLESNDEATAERARAVCGVAKVP